MTAPISCIQLQFISHIKNKHQDGRIHYGLVTFAHGHKTRNDILSDKSMTKSALGLTEIKHSWLN